jgi:hypothetical protein
MENKINNKTHELKTWPEYWHEVRRGSKNFELRLDDRNYQVGDQLNLNLFHPENGYLGNDCLIRYVSYKLNGGQFGLQDGYCILGLSKTPIN